LENLTVIPIGDCVVARPRRPQRLLRPSEQRQPGHEPRAPPLCDGSRRAWGRRISQGAESDHGRESIFGAW